MFSYQAQKSSLNFEQRSILEMVSMKHRYQVIRRSNKMENIEIHALKILPLVKTCAIFRIYRQKTSPDSQCNMASKKGGAVKRRREVVAEEDHELGTHRGMADIIHVRERPDTYIGSLDKKRDTRRLIVNRTMADGLGLVWKDLTKDLGGTSARGKDDGTTASIDTRLSSIGEEEEDEDEDEDEDEEMKESIPRAAVPLREKGTMESKTDPSPLPIITETGVIDGDEKKKAAFDAGVSALDAGFDGKAPLVLGEATVLSLASDLPVVAGDDTSDVKVPKSKARAKKMSKASRRRLYAAAEVEGDFSPALLGCFKEILSNAADHAFSEPSVTTIKVGADLSTGRLSVYNDGTGIPVRRTEHTNENYIVQECFTNFRFSSNFGDKSAAASRFMGVVGRNGLGAKIASALSSKFEVESFDASVGLLFEQSWSDGMQTSSGHSVKKKRGKKNKHTGKKDGGGYTQIHMVPDYPIFFLEEGLTSAIHAEIHTLVWEMAACLSSMGGDRKISVYFNDELLPVEEVRDFASVFFNVPSGSKLASDCVNDPGMGTPALVVTAAPALDETGQVFAFVNSIPCHEGSHVKLVTQALMTAAKSLLTEKLRKRPGVSRLLTEAITSSLNLCILTVLPDPAFNEQRKSELTTKLPIGWTPSSTFLTALRKSGVVAAIKARVEAIDGSKQIAEERKETKNLTGKDGSLSLAFVPKLDDAPNARKRLGRMKLPCGKSVTAPTASLFLTEGDSAKTMVVAAMGALSRKPRNKCKTIGNDLVDCRDDFGVMPLKGKPINVAKESKTKIDGNSERRYIEAATGLCRHVDFTKPENFKMLRVRRIILGADQDDDGFHIQGISITLFRTLYPSVFEVYPDFLCILSTPIVEIQHRRDEKRYLEFMTQHSYKQWLVEAPAKQRALWKDPIYKKGLGTSSTKDAQRYFKDLASHIYAVSWTGDASDDAMRVMLGPSSDARKQALNDKLDLTAEVDRHAPSVSVEDIMYKQVLLHSYANCCRMLPGMDGFKTVQRMIMAYMGMHGPVARSIKVAVLAGKIGEWADYHHGEASMCGAISSLGRMVKFTNNFGGLLPQGQCGSAHMSADRATASPRYLEMSVMSSILNGWLCMKADMPTLTKRITESSESVPMCFAPAVPGVLVNGCAAGIGSGFSSFIPPYHLPTLMTATEKLIALLGVDVDKEDGGSGSSAGAGSSPTSTHDLRVAAAQTSDEFLRVHMDQPSTQPLVGSKSMWETSFRKEVDVFLPHWEDFTGHVVRDPETEVIRAYGTYTLSKPTTKGEMTMTVTELAPGSTTSPWASWVEGVLRIGCNPADWYKEQGKNQPKVPPHTFVRRVTNTSAGRVTQIELVLDVAASARYMKDPVNPLTGYHDRLVQALDLSISVSLSNMHIITPDNKIVKYDSVADAFFHYAPHKLRCLRDRKAHTLDRLPRSIAKEDAKMRYLSGIADGSILLFRRKRVEVVADLARMDFPYDDYVDGTQAEPQSGTASFKYLLNLKTTAFLGDDDEVTEGMAKMVKHRDALQAQLEELQETSLLMMWQQDLVGLRDAHTAYLVQRGKENPE